MFTCIKIRKYLNAQTFIIYLHLLVPGKCISLLALKWDETIKHTHRPGSSTGYTSLKPHLSTWKGVFYFYPATKIPAGALMKSVRPCNEIAMFSCVFYTKNPCVLQSWWIFWPVSFSSRAAGWKHRHPQQTLKHVKNLMEINPPFFYSKDIR